jgi:uncharacterized protein
MGEERDTARRRDRTVTGAVAVVVVAVLLGGVGLGLGRTGATSASATPSTAPPTSCASSAPHLTVQGTGQGAGTPDVLTAVFGFTTTAGSSASALSQNNGEVAQALQALTAGGVAKRDLQTTALDLAAHYASPHGVPTLTGYQASETVTATLRQLPTDGTTIDDVVNATGDAAQITSLSFSFGDPSSVQDEARTAAVHQAVSHAQAMAAAAGRKLGLVCSLTDDTQPASPYLNAAALPSGGAAPSVPLEPGTQVESDQVTMVYALGG